MHLLKLIYNINKKATLLNFWSKIFYQYVSAWSSKCFEIIFKKINNFEEIDDRVCWFSNVG